MTTSAPTVQTVASLVDASSFRDDGTPGFDGRPIYAERVVLEWCARSIITPRGSAAWAPNVGEYFPELRLADLSATELEGRRRAYEIQLGRVSFVVKAQVSLKVDSVTGAATLQANITIRGSGVYPLAVSVSQAGAITANFFFGATS